MNLLPIVESEWLWAIGLARHTNKNTSAVGLRRGGKSRKHADDV